MDTQPHDTPEQSAALAALYLEAKSKLHAADSECLAAIGQDEYPAADARRKALRADARNLSEQLYSLDPVTWRAIESAASTTNAANPEENIMTKKATKTTATTAKGSSKKSSKKAAAQKPEQTAVAPAAEAPRDLTVEYDSEAARLRAEVEAREVENADTVAEASAAFDNVEPAGAKGSKKSPAARARKAGKVSGETHDRAAAAVAETGKALVERAEQNAAAAPPEGQPAASKGGARKGGAKGASKAAEQPAAGAATAQPSGEGRTEKLTKSALSIFDRIHKATPEKPITRGDLASNGDRNIARGLSKLELVVRLEDEKGRNIRYHAKAGVDAKAAHERIRQVAASEPKTFA
ncbi:MAG TPA: hypothetical protein VF668_01315 [Pyrinomonadaceae bacterium]|jgi:hypothetical protein